MTSQEEYEISFGTLSDVETIARFQIDMAYESEGTVLDQDTVRQGVRAVMEDKSKGRYIIARFGGKTVGSMMLTVEWSDWNCAWYWWIQSVYVMPEYRQMGIFSAMYHTLKDIAARQGVSQIRLYVDKSNETAQNAYRKLGMQASHYQMFEKSVTSKT